MKQITVILHYDDDQEAADVYASLRQIWREEPEQSMAILGKEIRYLKMVGPNDE